MEHNFRCGVCAARIVIAGLTVTGCSAYSDLPAPATRIKTAADSVSYAAGSGGQGPSAGASTGPSVVPEPSSIAVQGGAPAVAPSAGTGGEPVSCAAISQQAQNQRQPADIIFAVDNSGSMGDEIGFVRDRLNAFSRQIVASGIDARIILISGALEHAIGNGICIAAPLGSDSCPEDSKAPAYLHVPVRVGSHDALSTIIETYPRWRNQLRPNARKTIVVVTDDDAGGRMHDSAAAFQQSVAALEGGLLNSWTFSGIYCFSRCRDAASIGTVYGELVMQTHGVGGDLCEQNFAPVFDALAKAVIAGSNLDCEWNIPAPPAGQTFNRKQVNVQYRVNAAAPMTLTRVPDAAACGMRSAWHYDNEADPKRIVACPATCDALRVDGMAKLDVLFGCESMLAPN
jgi:hypothetical protein